MASRRRYSCTARARRAPSRRTTRSCVQAPCHASPRLAVSPTQHDRLLSCLYCCRGGRPCDYQFTGQPVLIGGTMGTCSYVLTGTESGMAQTFGSTCHGAGRAKSRAGSRRQMDYTEVLDALQQKGISIRVASPKLVMEESPESYKDVTQVVETCHAAGLSNKCVKLRPIAVIKG